MALAEVLAVVLVLFTNVLLALGLVSFIGGWRSVSRAGPERLVLKSASTQTDERGVLAARQRPEQFLYFAPLSGQKFHFARNCEGLRRAHAVSVLERCKLCG